MREHAPSCMRTRKYAQMRGGAQRSLSILRGSHAQICMRVHECAPRMHEHECTRTHEGTQACMSAA